MVLLASTFLDSSLAVLPPPPPPPAAYHAEPPPSCLPQQHRHFPLRPLAQLPPSSSSSPHGLSKQQQQHGFDQPPEASLQTKAHSWIPFFFFGSGKKAGKPLVGQRSGQQPSSPEAESESVLSSSSVSASAPSQDQGPYSIITPPDAQIMASPSPVKKSNTRGGHKKVVVFTPQKAQELRKKLKGTDSFHDFMYHSAIASRLASPDNDH